MTAELAKPDSMGDLDQDDEDEDETGGGVEDEGPEEPREDGDQGEAEEREAGERESLLTGDQKENSSPSIQLVAGAGEAALARTLAVTGTSIKVDIEQGHSPRYVPDPLPACHIYLSIYDLYHQFFLPSQS